MEMDGEQHRVQTSNEAYTEPNVLQYRLDTDGILDNLKAFLQGGRISYEKDIETNEIKGNFVKEGASLCNDLGVQSILAWIKMLINSGTVQGNWEEERFNRFLEKQFKSLALNLLINTPRYGIDPQDRLFIINGVKGMVEMFVSRLINNEERISYSQSLPTRISNFSQSEKKRML